MDGFSELTAVEKQQVVAGSWISLIGNIGKVVGLIEGGITVVSHVTGLFKSTTTMKGEIKTKSATFKWDNTKGVHPQETPIYYTY